MAGQPAARFEKGPSHESGGSVTPEGVFDKVVDTVDASSVENAPVAVETLLVTYRDAPFYEDLKAKAKAALVASGRLDGRVSAEFGIRLGHLVVASLGSLDGPGVMGCSSTGASTEKAPGKAAPK